MYLNEMELDALGEVINVGVGFAASSLNELVGTPISLQVPEVSVMPLEEATGKVSAFAWNRVSSVQLAFSGPIRGIAALLFPYDSAVELVSLLTDDQGSSKEVDTIRAATLEETGNIILNGVVGSISNLLGGQISFSIPYYSEQGGLPGRLMGVQPIAGAHVVVARARFRVAEHEIEGEIFLFLDTVALENLTAALGRLIESPV